MVAGVPGVIDTLPVTVKVGNIFDTAIIEAEFAGPWDNSAAFTVPVMVKEGNIFPAKMMDAETAGAIDTGMVYPLGVYTETPGPNPTSAVRDPVTVRVGNTLAIFMMDADTACPTAICPVTVSVGHNGIIFHDVPAAGLTWPWMVRPKPIL